LLNTNNDRVEVFTIMRALDPEVVEVIWRAVEPLIPTRQVTHPLGCHRQRASDRACFAVMLVRLATGCSWEDAERLCGSEVSDTTVRDRRDEWIAAGVFDAIAAEAIGGYDRIIGVDLSDVAVDGCLHKAPAGGEGTGPNPTDRASSDGNGRSSPTATGSPSDGPSTAPTATTRRSSHPPSTTPPGAAC
jgi:transposase